jgi:hypothetical protein
MSGDGWILGFGLVQVHRASSFGRMIDQMWMDGLNGRMNAWTAVLS